MIYCHLFNIDSNADREKASEYIENYFRAKEQYTLGNINEDNTISIIFENTTSNINIRIIGCKS